MDEGSDETRRNEEHIESAVEELPGILIQPPPCLQSEGGGGVYFILEKASLCVANVGKRYQILNPDDHATFLRRQNKDPYNFRPDIVHEALLQIMGSRLRMAVELLQKFRIKAKGNNATLLRVVKNPVTNHLPINSHKIGLSYSSTKTAQLRDYISNTTHNENFVFVVGAMAHGKIETDYVDDLISVSGHRLSAGTCLRRICIALERNWKIL